MNRLLPLLFVLLIFSCKTENKGTDEEQRWQQHAENTEIIRDDFGVPHIYGKTDADAVFGLLFIDLSCTQSAKRRPRCIKLPNRRSKRSNFTTI